MSERSSRTFAKSSIANSEEPREFTDYLKFFELVAVLQKSGQLTTEQIEDLFGYYLNCLERSAAVRKYISAEGYEQLDRLLREGPQKK